MLDLLLLHRTNTNHIEINVSFTLLNCKIPCEMCCEDSGPGKAGKIKIRP